MHLAALSALTRGFSFPLFTAALALGLVASRPVAAQTVVTIVNPSFESPTVAGPSPDFIAAATGWTPLNATPTGVFSPGIPGVTPAAVDGSQVGFANGFGGLQQILSTTFVAGNVYDFSVYIGLRSDDIGTPFGNLNFGYYDGSNFRLISSITSAVAPTPGNFVFVAGSYRSTGAEVGLPIALQLTNTGTPQVVFDSVQVLASVPEPASVAALAALACLAATVVVRRRRPHSGLSAVAAR